MQPVTYEGVEVDRCTGCFGIFFDARELDDLLERDGSDEALDVGDPKVGKRYNQVDRIACPRCQGGRMVRLVDADQPHIWYEQCPVCNGSFLDAGEFKDLAHETIADFFRGLFVKERP